MELLYFHGSTLQAMRRQGKVRFLVPLNPRGMFDSVRLVNLDTQAREDVDHVDGCFHLTAVALGRLGAGPWAKWRSLRQAIDRVSRQSSPALVLADDANLLGLSARWVARRLCVPYALCIYYDNDLHYRLTGRPALAFLRSRALERMIERWLLRGAVGVYGGNRGYRDYALRHGAHPERTYLGSWSVDDIFYADPPTPHPDAREVLIVSRLHALKFLDDVIDAVTRLSPSVRLDIAGEGSDRTRLGRLIAARGVDNRVRFLGTVPREDLRRRMQGARALVVTQGFNAVVEGLLSGRPVIAYDHECNGEVVRDGDTGLLVPFRDVDALAGALGRVLGDAAFGEGLGRRARLQMLEECDLSRSIDHRRRFFERCLAG